MDTMFWSYHKNKDRIREFILPKKPIQVGIWLPADECCCVKKAYKAGLLDEAREIHLVERDLDLYEKMVINAPVLPSIKPFYGKLENLVLQQQVDYAYLDYLGGMNRIVSQWMAGTLSPKLTEGATVAITQMLAKRSNKLISAQASLLRQKEGVLVNRCYGHQHPDMQMMLILLHRIFCDWDFEIASDTKGGIPQYRDTVNTMLVFKLVNLRRSERHFRPLNPEYH